MSTKHLLINKKISTIPQLLHENHFLTDFKEIAKLFNIFFLKENFPVRDNCSILNDVDVITDKRLSTVAFLAGYIRKIIQNFDSSKAHGHGSKSICMLKIWNVSICIRLEKIFELALFTGVFPSEWEKRNMVPIHKKCDKQNIENYNTISLLPLIFNEIFKSLSSNKLVSKHQSGKAFDKVWHKGLIFKL